MIYMLEWAKSCQKSWEVIWLCNWKFCTILRRFWKF